MGFFELRSSKHASKSRASVGKDSIGVFNALLIEENAAMMAEGAKTTSIGYSLSEANALFAERAMEVAIEASGATGEAFRDFVASKGM